jgi:AraC-like DNA-binding protein
MQWPDALLASQPIDRVFVCGRQLPSPLHARVINVPRLEVPLSGCYENQIELKGSSVTLGLLPGTALFVPPKCWNVPNLKPPVRLISFLFGEKQLDIRIVTSMGRDGAQATTQRFSFPRPFTGPVGHILDAMLELETTSSSDTTLVELARALLSCLHDQLRRSARPRLAPSQALLEEICAALQTNYQCDISRDSIAQQFSISPSHLSRLFRQHAHTTFTGYLTRVRIGRAKRFLAHDNSKLDDVAARCGYHDTSYFCRVFKRFTKLSPAAYRTSRRVYGVTEGAL